MKDHLDKRLGEQSEQLDEAKDYASMTDADLKKHINTRLRNGIAHNLSKAASDSLKAAQDELKNRRRQQVVKEENVLVKRGKELKVTDDKGNTHAEGFPFAVATIHSPGHRLHGKKAYVNYMHADGRINVQIRNSPSDATNLTLKQGQFKLHEDVEVDDGTTELREGLISYNEFRDKIEMHRKAGNRVIDDKYGDDKASYITIDKDGVGRKIVHTASGARQTHLGRMTGDDDEVEVKPQPEKRGRGRPVGSKSGARRHK